MTTPAATSHPPAHLAALHTDATRGLTAVPKALPPKWLYDAAGSALFEQIVRLPEYPYCRTEQALLTRCSPDIAANTRAPSAAEPGSGGPEETLALVDALAETVTTDVPVDVSSRALDQAAPGLSAACPRVSAQPRIADFTAPLDLDDVDGPRLVMLLGGTIGNLLPDERAEFFASLAPRLTHQGRLLLCVHLVTDPRVLLPAYNDSAGVTATFNRGVPHRINRALGIDFDVDGSEHITVWDAENEWIEMRLRAGIAQTVRLDDHGIDVRFAAGEDLRTEVSAKFRSERLARELDAVALELHMIWTDPDALVAPALRVLPAA
ncbi:L-histidine N(alpha)-methyltransferase [Streptomyces chartreusis]|uniref:L-histidine N(alpha)-methyltransferase n=1 Tax=Streptomyces chartreusis TaxID=1969 RepID=UPI0036BF1136